MSLIVSINMNTWKKRHKHESLGHLSFFVVSSNESEMFCFYDLNVLKKNIAKPKVRAMKKLNVSNDLSFSLPLKLDTK